LDLGDPGNRFRGFSRILANGPDGEGSSKIFSNFQKRVGRIKNGWEPHHSGGGLIPKGKSAPVPKPLILGALGARP